MEDLPEAGIGMMYFAGLQAVVESHYSLFQVLEIEPQTLWYGKDAEGGSIKFDAAQNNVLQAYPCQKLFHSVGFPVGGTIVPDESQFNALREHIDLLKPLWISEHLSFNNFRQGNGVVNTNFLLPPLQTQEGIQTAVSTIDHFRSKTNLPFAFETGVNYLKPVAGQLPDGNFVARVAEDSDCHILLDLHNVLANQLNGRQSVAAFVNQLPLERVMEIHVAGGFTYHGYYLDAHAGPASAELLSVLERIVRRLPALKAIIFEMLPGYAGKLPEREMRAQLETLHRIWDGRGKMCKHRKHKKTARAFTTPDQLPGVITWENTLGKLAIGQPVEKNEMTKVLQDDPGLKIINELIFHFRASMVISTLTLTSRLLRLKWGTDAFNALIRQFMAGTHPEAFPYRVAKKFADFLVAKKYSVELLYPLLAYELAVLETLMDNRERKVVFDYNPFPVFRELSNFELPGVQDQQVCVEIEIVPDDLISTAGRVNFSAVYHS